MGEVSRFPAAETAAERRGPIARPSLHEQLVGNLRRMIMDGDLAPGSKVPEKTLCEQFDVSRTPLREALKVLASEGLLSLQPNRGAVVTELTLADVTEMFPVMGALEALSGELAASRIDEDDLAEIRALHYQMVLHYRRAELPAYFRLNQMIHEKILEAAGNPTLTALHRSLSGRIRRARYMANMSQARWDKAVAEHEEILAALESRDGVRLARILKDHLANKCETVREALQADA